MAERASKRPAGVTRIPKTPTTDAVPTFDFSAFTRPQLDRVALDRGLSITGSDADVRARIIADLEV